MSMLHYLRDHDQGRRRTCCGMDSGYGRASRDPLIPLREE
jgi:hypothetical protein